jgi:hypothetical protein
MNFPSSYIAAFSWSNINYPLLLGDVIISPLAGAAVLPAFSYMASFFILFLPIAISLYSS